LFETPESTKSDMLSMIAKVEENNLIRIYGNVVHGASSKVQITSAKTKYLELSHFAYIVNKSPLPNSPKKL